MHRRIALALLTGAVAATSIPEFPGRYVAEIHALNGK
jgi:hypothetical protein